MPSLTNILMRSEALTHADRDWIHQLVGDWQIIADVAFSDLLLVVDGIDGSVQIAAQCRPTTAQTIYEDDVVGSSVPDDVRDAVRRVLAGGERERVHRPGYMFMILPVQRAGKKVAALCVAQLEQPDISPAQLPAQIDYWDVSGTLLSMVTRGEFPFDGSATGYRHGTPRVTDGYTHLDADGTVLYASPNAVSNYHRIGVAGSLVGQVLVESVTNVIEDHSVVEESLPVVMMGRAPWLSELETHGVILSLRAVPLTRKGERVGGILLSRDITEIRRREMELLTKDATIREINHRVKNNLQTVSALLRMQSRRVEHNEEARIALENAQRRVQTIALVHQTLSEKVDERVDFSEVFAPLLGMARDIAATGITVTSSLEGEFGQIGAAKTTTLAVVLNELVSNAVEHGLPNGGHIAIRVERSGSRLGIDIVDNGVGIDIERAGKGLGTKIVKTLVEGELAGSIKWTRPSGGGTQVHIEANVGS